MEKLSKYVQEYVKRKLAKLDLLLLNYAGNMESYAKENRPWKDQTTHARGGLHSGVEYEADGTRILFLSHSMHYGEYLETGTGIHGPRKKPIIIKKVSKRTNLPHEVKRQGMEPRPIIKPTVDKYMEPLKKDIREVFGD